jgi:hypothetical protein
MHFKNQIYSETVIIEFVRINIKPAHLLIEKRSDDKMELVAILYEIAVGQPAICFIYKNIIHIRLCRYCLQ